MGVLKNGAAWTATTAIGAKTSVVARNLRQGVRKVVIVDSGRRFFYAQAFITQKSRTKLCIFFWQGVRTHPTHLVCLRLWLQQLCTLLTAHYFGSQILPERTVAENYELAHLTWIMSPHYLVQATNLMPDSRQYTQHINRLLSGPPTYYWGRLLGL